jgi:hypothetical protein
MSVLTAHLHLPHPRRIPRQATVSATCLTPTCLRYAADTLPELGTCPSCQQPLTETRTVTR